MRIVILFHFLNEPEPSAVTVAEGAITDMLVPLLGDTVCHRDQQEAEFRGVVVGRHFDYRLANGLEGEEIDGTITVTLSLTRLAIN
jgi:hypothetical protein